MVDPSFELQRIPPKYQQVDIYRHYTPKVCFIDHMQIVEDTLKFGYSYYSLMVKHHRTVKDDTDARELLVLSILGTYQNLYIPLFSWPSWYDDFSNEYPHNIDILIYFFGKLGMRQLILDFYALDKNVRNEMLKADSIDLQALEFTFQEPYQIIAAKLLASSAEFREACISVITKHFGFIRSYYPVLLESFFSDGSITFPLPSPANEAQPLSPEEIEQQRNILDNLKSKNPHLSTLLTDFEMDVSKERQTIN